MALPPAVPRPTADEALARLIAGNDRFLRGEARAGKLPRETLADLARGQQPFATVLGCSDSRVPPERAAAPGPSRARCAGRCGASRSRPRAGRIWPAAG